MIGEVVKRIEARLARLGMSAAEASKLAGKPDAIRNMQRAARDAPGRKGANTATISALAQDDDRVATGGSRSRGSV